MNTLVYSVLHGIEIGLWMMSGCLLTGALIGPYVKTRFLADGRSRPLSGRSFREKRRTFRTATDILVDLNDVQGGFIPGAARLQNISMSGACMTSVVPLNRGAHIQGRLSVMNGEFQRISGRVVWSRHQSNRNLYGLRFE